MPDEYHNKRSELYQGLGNTLAVAFEFAVTPAIMAAIGYAIDHAIGIVPIFTIVFGVLGFIGMSLKLWFGYDHEMRIRDTESSWYKARQAALTVGDKVDK